MELFALFVVYCDKKLIFDDKNGYIFFILNM